MLEQPLVRALSNKHNVFVCFPGCPQVRSALGNNGAEPVNLYSSQYCRSYSFWVLKNDAAESNIDWWRSTLYEGTKLSRWLILRGIAKEKPADVDILWPVRWLWYEGRRPAVSKGNLECRCKSWTIKHSYLLQVKLIPPLIDGIAKSVIHGKLSEMFSDARDLGDSWVTAYPCHVSQSTTPCTDSL